MSYGCVSRLRVGCRPGPFIEEEAQLFIQIKAVQYFIKNENITGAGPLSRRLRLCNNCDDGIAAKITNPGLRWTSWQGLFGRGNWILSDYGANVRIQSLI